MYMRHERPDVPLSLPVRAPLTLTLPNGKNVHLSEWNLAGFTYPEAGELPREAVLTIPFQGIDLTFPVAFTPVPGTRELRFKGLSGRGRETLALFYRNLLNGRMAAVDEIITSLDTPVDLVPMGETEEEVQDGTKGKSPRMLRIILNVAFYILTAAVLFGLIGTTLTTRLTQVPLSHARVVSQSIEVRAPGAGYVESVETTLGALVKQGDVLARISDPARDARVDDARRAVPELERALSDAKAMLRIHNSGQALARQPFAFAVEAEKQSLTFRDYFGGYNLEALKVALERLALFDAGKSQVEDDFHARRKELVALRTDKERALSRGKRALSNAKAAARAYDLVAPEDGTVAEILSFEGQYLGRGAQGFELTSNAAPTLQAWLLADKVESVWPGMAISGKAVLADGPASVTGHIISVRAEVDETTGAGYGLVITAAFEGADLPIGTPLQLMGLKPLRVWGAK